MLHDTIFEFYVTYLIQKNGGIVQLQSDADSIMKLLNEGATWSDVGAMDWSGLRKVGLLRFEPKRLTSVEFIDVCRGGIPKGYFIRFYREPQNNNKDTKGKPAIILTDRVVVYNKNTWSIIW